MDNQIQRLIGVDFGTSTSLIRVKRYRGNQPVGDSYHAASVTYGNGAGDSKAVTVVRTNEDGSVTCGRYGEEETPGSTIHREFKMDLESEDPGRRQQARELTARFFEYLYQRYEHQYTDLGQLEDQERTLISYPAKWKRETVEFMENTAREAGFSNVTSMDEPTAALYAVLCRRMGELSRQQMLRYGETGYVLLIDMGAGTTDLAVCGYRINQSDESALTVEKIKTILVSTWPGDNSCLTFGGREVDRILEDYVVDYLQDCGFAPEMAANLVKGKPNVKLWKEDTVSNLLERNREVTTCSFTAPYTAIFGQSKPFPAFGRQQFQQMLSEKLDQFRQLVTDCLDDAVDTAPEIWEKGIDLVVLTGGHSSWYFTGELLDGTMPGLMHPTLEAVHRQKGRILRLTNPQETVALGLVYSRLPFQVEKLEDDENEVILPEVEEKTVAQSPMPPAPGVGNNDALSDDFLIQMNQLLSIYDRSLMPDSHVPINPKQYAYLAVPRDAQPFISFDSSWFNMGKSGTVFSKKGIYYRQGSGRPQFCSWKRFAEGTLELYATGEGPLLREGNRVTPILSFSSYNAQIRVYLQQLQERVRTLMPDTGSQVMLLPVPPSPHAAKVEQYLESQDPLQLQLLSRNVNVERLTARLSVPAGERVLFAHNSSNTGNSKFGMIMTDRGIYACAWLESPGFTSWENFSKGHPRLEGNHIRIDINGTDVKVGEISVSDEALQQYRQQWFDGLCAAVCTA